MLMITMERCMSMSMFTMLNIIRIPINAAITIRERLILDLAKNEALHI
jgi:hypothetical protein